MYYVYKDGEMFCTATFVGDKSKAELNGYKAITDAEYKKLCNRELCWKNGKLYPYPSTDEEKENENKQAKLARIAELKWLLSDSDYKALKFAEGYISAEDYAETKLARQSWRNEINDLENQIGGDV